MKLYAVYEVKVGGDATNPDTYCLKGLFIDEKRAEYNKDKLVFDHSYYKAEVYPIFIPDDFMKVLAKALSGHMEEE
jgi:hypothetical protein